MLPRDKSTLPDIYQAAREIRRFGRKCVLPRPAAQSRYSAKSGDHWRSISAIERRYQVRASARAVGGHVGIEELIDTCVRQSGPQGNLDYYAGRCPQID